MPAGLKLIVGDRNARASRRPEEELTGHIGKPRGHVTLS